MGVTLEEYDRLEREVKTDYVRHTPTQRLALGLVRLSELTAEQDIACTDDVLYGPGGGPDSHYFEKADILLLLSLGWRWHATVESWAFVV